MNLPAANHDPITPDPSALGISFEFFPPNTEKMERTLWASVERLAPLAPRFVSVTYGAGGGTRDRTHGIVNRIRRETTLEPAAHLTCVGATRDEVNSVARRYRDVGVTHIVALRGDPPEAGDGFTPHPRGYDGSVALVAGLKRIFDFEISVGGYPEPHPDSRGGDSDLDHLKGKIDAGANRVITQYFFDNMLYFRFVDRVRAAGITVPVVPGILPVTNFAQVARFSATCGTSIPPWLAGRFEGLDQDPQTRRLVAAHTATEQCFALQEAGVTDFHFYTLNRADLVFAICHVLGVRSMPAEAGPER
ncbi:MAG: methylenetetrahydrofolate reductase [NAD(P)H] [Alphaproteobacteria bacterium]|jgi:methylenetetrahydrofolate reductase (NADPH)|nr:methylenetetrahydrofolate reductase [NAD(P)H] [Alphaproteobacteria bacterium]MDP6517170.1 methylenetetrahydrofolate reductase [NAD(P)H] [Alphaproteobacteria bacterium]